MNLQSSYNRQPSIAPGEKIIAAASYLTMGVVGFLWIIISHVTGSKLKQFMRFHIFQSIFISILYYVFNIIMNILISVVVKIPIIGSLVYNLYFWIFDLKLIFGYSIVDTLVISIIVYLVINSLLGRLGQLPWVSNVIKGML